MTRFAYLEDRYFKHNHGEVTWLLYEQMSAALCARGWDRNKARSQVRMWLSGVRDERIHDDTLQVREELRYA